MSKLLLNLRMVLDDEAEDVRTLLESHGIQFYETQPSRWGISHGGIWITHDLDVVQAKGLMSEYQTQRGERARAERELALRDGTAETFASTLRRDPLRVGLTVLAILALIGLVALVPLLLMRH